MKRGLAFVGAISAAMLLVCTNGVNGASRQHEQLAASRWKTFRGKRSFK